MNVYQSYKHADAEIEYYYLTIESHWHRTQEQIRLLNEVWQFLKPDHQLNQILVLRRLLNTLSDGRAVLEGLRNVEAPGAIPTRSTDRGQRVRYAAKVKKFIQTTLDELVKWQKLFDVSYFLIAGEPDRLIDRCLVSIQTQVRDNKANPNLILKGFRDEVQSHSNLSKSFNFLPTTQLLPERQRVDMSPVQTGQVVGQTQRVLIDTFEGRDEYRVEDVTQDVMKLARVLGKVEPTTFGLLKCQGVCRITPNFTVPSFEFILEMPQGKSEPRSLRSILVNKIELDLNERFALAKSLARSVIYVHMSCFVHKNISPETILVFFDGKGHLNSSFLVGFRSFRFAQGITIQSSDDGWRENLYRHPRRQGSKPEHSFRMQHDIYSVGVVLLEIGLWTSFVTLQREREVLNEVPNPDLNPVLWEKLKSTNQTERAEEIKVGFLQLAEKELPICMGQRYSHVVQDCLKCLDKDSPFDHSRDFDKDGVDLGIHYMEHVCNDLSSNPWPLGRVLILSRLYSSLRISISSRYAEASCGYRLTIINKRWVEKSQDTLVERLRYTGKTKKNHQILKGIIHHKFGFTRVPNEQS